MSLISNVSFRVGDSSIGQFFNSSTKKTVIVLLAVAAIVALGFYLLRAGDCLHRFRANLSTSTSSSESNASTASLPSSSRVTPALNETFYKVPPRHIFISGHQREMTHYKRSDSLAGWVFIRADSEGNISSRMFFPFDPMILPSQINDEMLRNEIPNLDGCMTAQEVELSLREQSQVEETSISLVPDTRASKVPAHVFGEGERLGATHYLQQGVRRPFVDHAGWIIINDRELTSHFISEDDQTTVVCPYPTDTIGSITAEEVRECRPTANWFDRRDNLTDIPPEFILEFGEEHGATSYKYEFSHNCWHLFCGKKSYAMKRNGTFTQILGREIPPQANVLFNPENFFTAEQVRTHYERVRPRQPENRSSIVPGNSSGSCGMLIPVTYLRVPVRAADFGENCRATHYEYKDNGDWVIYCGESQSYVYGGYSPDDHFSRQEGESIEVLNQRIEGDFRNIFTAEQVSNDRKIQRKLIPDY